MRSHKQGTATHASAPAFASLLLVMIATSCKSSNPTNSGQPDRPGSPPRSRRQEPKASVGQKGTGAHAVDSARYRADLEFIAVARPPGSPESQAAQDRCAEVMQAVGMTVSRKPYAGGGVNVIGRRPGTTKVDEVVLIGAHYDSVPNCAGADDNASGVAGVLEVAQLLGGRTHQRTLVCACWDQEETGYLGSEAFVKNLSDNLGGTARLVAHFNLEMIAFASSAPYSQTVPSGFGQLFPRQIAALETNERRGDFIAVIADGASAGPASTYLEHATAVGLPAQRLDIPDTLKTSWLISDLRRSDHRSFWDGGLPGVMLTDTANFRNPNYHCARGVDRFGTLDLDFAVKVVAATAGAAAELLDR